MENIKYQEHKANLNKGLSESNNEDSKAYEGFYIKGDVSGIQDFIFNIKSKGASKALKARSFVVEQIAELCLKYIQDELKDCELLYSGGGNFYLFIKGSNISEEILTQQIDSLQSKINQELLYQEIYCAISLLKATQGDSFFDVWKNLNGEISGKDKLKKFNTDFPFIPYQALSTNNEDNYRKFTSQLVKSIGYEIEKGDPNKEFIANGQISMLGYNSRLTTIQDFTDEKHSLEARLQNKLPCWTEELMKQHKDLIDSSVSEGNIVEFSYLAEFAGIRTGTAKLGVLKMDGDNMGNIFKNKTLEQSKKISRSLKYFFEEYLLDLLNRTFQPIVGGNYYSNIYVVFSGGDDCFLIGAWDAVLSFAQVINEEFTKFCNNEISLSCGILVIDKNFPVKRFAELAEEALGEAKKRVEDGELKKNAISIFGEVLTWEEYRFAKSIKNDLVELVEQREESKAIIHAVKRSSLGFETLQQKALNGKLDFRNLWRFQYSLRNVKKKNIDFVNTKIISKYQKILLNAISKDKDHNPATFAVAARWAEYSVKK